MTGLVSLSALGVVAVLAIVFSLCRTIYQLTLHPLVKYPGPFINKISGWPDVFQAMRGRRHLYHYELHCQYGPVVRYAPNKLTFNSPRASHDINADRKANVVKTDFTAATAYINRGESTHSTANKKLHSFKRRLLGHAFSEAAIKNAEDFALERIRTFCEKMNEPKTQVDISPDASGWSASKNMAHWYSLLTLDVLGELCFGKNFEGLEKGDDEIIHTLQDAARITQSIAFLPIAAIIWPVLRNRSILTLLSKKFAEKRFAFRLRMADLTQKRGEFEVAAEKEGTSTRKDFFHYLFRATDPETGNKFPRESFVPETSLLVAAGTDTSSRAMASTLFYLLKNPVAMNKLKKEVRDAFGDVEEIRSGVELSSLNYLRACIDESMRMTPPVAGGLSRLVEAGGINVDGNIVPVHV